MSEISEVWEPRSCDEREDWRECGERKAGDAARGDVEGEGEKRELKRRSKGWRAPEGVRGRPLRGLNPVRKGRETCEPRTEGVSSGIDEDSVGLAIPGEAIGVCGPTSGISAKSSMSDGDGCSLFNPSSGHVAAPWAGSGESSGLGVRLSSSAVVNVRPSSSAVMNVSSPSSCSLDDVSTSSNWPGADAGKGVVAGACAGASASLSSLEEVMNGAPSISSPWNSSYF